MRLLGQNLGGSSLKVIEIHSVIERQTCTHTHADEYTQHETDITHKYIISPIMFIALED